MAENPVVSKRHICGQLSPHDVTPLLSHIFGGLAPTYLSINFVRGTRLGEFVSLYKQLEPFADVAGLAIGDPAGQRFSSTEQQYTTITTIGHEC